MELNAAKPATEKKSAQPAIPEIREADTVIPAISTPQATPEVILDQAACLKSRATICPQMRDSETPPILFASNFLAGRIARAIDPRHP